MRLVIERGDLLGALSHVTSVVERRTTIPILSNVMISASAGEIRFKATDLEREVVETVSADVAQSGAITVPAHMLHDIVRKLPDGAQVSLERDGERERLLLVSGQARFALQILPAEDFPDLGAGEMSHEFSLPAHELKRSIEKTRFAMSTEETRYYLNGVYLHIAPGQAETLRAVATDGHRLAKVDLPRPAGSEGLPGIIVPRKTVHELHRLLEDSSAEVTIAASTSRVRFTTGQVTLVSKLIDGPFPDYARVIPQANDKEMRVPNSEFAAAVDRVSTIASERGRAVKLAIGDGKLVLSVNNPEGGSATEEIDIDYASTALEIGFNARYLLDISSQLESDFALFKLADPGSPTIIMDSEDDAALYVLMPMRV